MRILLNKARRENYMFIDRDSNCYLDLQSPGADVPKVTPSIRRGIIGGTIIDVDQESGIELPEDRLKFNAAYLASLGIVPKTKLPKEDKSAIEQLNEAQANDEKNAKGKGKNTKKKEDVEDGKVQEN